MVVMAVCADHGVMPDGTLIQRPAIVGLDRGVLKEVFQSPLDARSLFGTPTARVNEEDRLGQHLGVDQRILSPSVVFLQDECRAVEPFTSERRT